MRIQDFGLPTSKIANIHTIWSEIGSDLAQESEVAFATALPILSLVATGDSS